MRAKDSKNGLTALAVAGTNVVLIGWDMAENDIRAKNVLGFAIRRTRHEDGEIIWMPGMKTFETVEPNPEPGALVTSFRHPIQSFQWSDYTVSPDKAYTYRVIARTGTPTALADGPSVNLDVRTERVDLGKHAVFFNRGAIASQEYARRFFNIKPDEIGQPAFDWLSRGSSKASRHSSRRPAPATSFAARSSSSRTAGSTTPSRLQGSAARRSRSSTTATRNGRATRKRSKGRASTRW